MPPGPRCLVGGALIALTIAGCGAAASGRGGGAAVSPNPPPRTQAPALPAARWSRLRLPSGAVLPYPAGWRVVAGDPGSASAALYGPERTIRAYLNATPAEGHETLAGWARFRVRHNAAEGDRGVRLIAARTGVRLAGGRAACVIDDYATSRSRYRELACIVAPADRGKATVLVAAAQPSEWGRERPLLESALDHFTA